MIARRVFLSAVSVCLAAQALTASSSFAADKTVKVGLILAMTGHGAAIGQSIERGATLYYNLHKKDLPPGVDLQIIRRDDASNPDTTRRLAQELLVRDHVQMLAGIALSNQGFALAPLMTEAKVPLILMNATTGSLTRSSPYIVRVSHTQWQSAYTMGKWSTEHGYKKAYTLVSDYAAGIDTEEAFNQSFKASGGQIVGAVRVPMSTTDFLPYMNRIKAASPDSLFMFTNAGRMTTAAVKAFADSGMKAAGVQLLGPGDIAIDDELPEMGKAVIGLTTAGVYLAENPAPGNQAFVKQWKAAYGEKTLPNFMAAAGWDGMAAIFAVATELKGDVTGEAAMKVLKNWKNPDSPKGAIAIDPETRDVVLNIYIDKVEDVKGVPTNVTIQTIHDVKDPWKILNPPK